MVRKLFLFLVVVNISLFTQAASAAADMIIPFLMRHAYGTLYAYSTLHRTPQLHGFVAPNTNAVATDYEENRLVSLLLSASVPFGRFHGGNASVTDGIVVADRARRTIIVEQNAKGTGGVQFSIMQYDGTLPATIPTRSLPALTIAGITIGSPVSDVLHRFGKPYSTASIGPKDRIGTFTEHGFGDLGWAPQSTPPDGVYLYAGPVPQKSQTCIRSFAIVIRSQRVRGIREAVAC